jgi:hypothetical protein
MRAAFPEGVATSVIEPRNMRRNPTPVEAARVAIWRLFEEGYVDEDMATAGLLAVDVGTRRAQRRSDTLQEATPPSTRRLAR